MGTKKAKWRQAELRLSYGAEMWVIVRHRQGAFRLPVTASVEELLWGIAAGWTFDSGTMRLSPSDPVRPDTRALARFWEEGSVTPSD